MTRRGEMGRAEGPHRHHTKEMGDAGHDGGLVGSKGKGSMPPNERRIKYILGRGDDVANPGSQLTYLDREPYFYSMIRLEHAEQVF